MEGGNSYESCLCVFGIASNIKREATSFGINEVKKIEAINAKSRNLSS